MARSMRIPVVVADTLGPERLAACAATRPVLLTDAGRVVAVLTATVACEHRDGIDGRARQVVDHLRAASTGGVPWSADELCARLGLDPAQVRVEPTGCTPSAA